MGNVFYKIDETMGRLGKKLLDVLGPKLGFRCEIFYPIDSSEGIYPSSGSYLEYRETPDEILWLFITGIITQDMARTGSGPNDPATTDQEKRAIGTKLLPLGTKIRVLIPGRKEMDLKVVKVLQDATRTRSFFVHIVEPIL